MEIFDRLFDFIVNRWQLVGAFAALLVALFYVEGRRAGRKVGPQEAVQLLNHDEAIIVDVRERKEFREGHIKGALHMPLASVAENKRELQKHSDKLIILADKSGQHAAMAGKQLQKEGLNVARLAGGMMDWRAANLPVAKEEKPESKKEIKKEARKDAKKK
ncbi:MAG: rhodanese-like domain-containing protein [Halomonadaceae bacterium]|nr:MAG: rhodanese-like domain-containing protein [Halomonadaceae bacterium]